MNYILNVKYSFIIKIHVIVVLGCFSMVNLSMLLIKYNAKIIILKHVVFVGFFITTQTV